MTDTEALRTKIADLMPGVLEDLMALARIPSVSALPEHDKDVQASAEAVAELLRAEGAEVKVVAEGGKPAVIGRVAGPEPVGGKRPARVLLYAHHDVQPAGVESQWASAPFEPQQRGERLYGRGTADDKAGVMAHLAALRAFGGKPPVEVIVFVEGEEESGSASLPALLDKYRDELECDVIVLADSSNWAVGTPALTTSLRGNVRLKVTLSTLAHGLHSGMFGGVVPDAITTMCRLLGTLHNADGSVAVPGLVSEETSGVDYTAEEIRRDSSVLDGVELIGKGTFASRLWLQPTVTVVGFDAPAVEGAANLLSPSCSALLSVRIAPAQDAAAAAAAVTKFLQDNAPWGAQVEVEVEDAAPGSALPASGPIVEAARSALRSSWGTEPVDAGIGGSIPFVAQFNDTFPQAVVLVTGVEDPDTRAHSTDEGLHLGDFEHACVAEALMFEKIAQVWKG
ncbi:Succinyl-diaminopimelate desuccinylase [Dermatophilus congolensis]|uniref:Succinyl-diaminopimelate desuccinylase n=1 Tax=Dermatophilus congolensis TaxID=1863 RepID=A0AA46BND1_9MICO|nr:dipeptidase [Dermatophilus congolensis]STD09994.1 Succinyl-diaminopimelate desuccinylase [Dermatophilus congolensis]